MKFKVKAIKVGTRVGPDGTIIHVNPDGSDPRAREPIVDEGAIPILLEEPALIEDPGDLSKLKAEVEGGIRFLDVSRIDELAARDVAAIAPIDDERTSIPSGLGHREAVHYDPNQRVGAAASGIQADDPDAPKAEDYQGGAKAVVDNRTAAGTTVTDASIVSGGKEVISPSQEDGTIQPEGAKPAARRRRAEGAEG